MRIGSRFGVVTAASAVGLIGAITIGVVHAAADPAAEAPTENNGGSIVEDYSYPGAAGILETYNVKLISGDGHILFADCATPPVGDIGVIKVWTTPTEDVDGRMVCFKVTGVPGRLDLEVPAVYEIRGDGQRSGTGHDITAEVTTDDGVHTTVAVNPSGSTQVGVGIDPSDPPTTLLQLKVAA